MSDEPQDTRDRSTEPFEPHLFDFSSLAPAAEWLAQAAAAGVVGAAAYDLLRAVKARFGGEKIADLRSKVHDVAEGIKRKPNVSKRDLRQRIDQLFDEYES